MKNIDLHILFLLSCIIFSCDSQDEPVATLVDINIRIFVVSEEGVDLLDPENPMSIKASEVKFFEIIDGNIVLIGNSNDVYFDSPEPIVEEARYSLQLSPNTFNGEDYSVSYIQWNDTDTDTLKCEVDQGSNFLTVTKVWFNDDLVWSMAEDGDLRQFEIIK